MGPVRRVRPHVGPRGIRVAFEDDHLVEVTRQDRACRKAGDAPAQDERAILERRAA